MILAPLILNLSLVFTFTYGMLHSLFGMFMLPLIMTLACGESSSESKPKKSQSHQSTASPKNTDAKQEAETTAKKSKRAEVPRTLKAIKIYQEMYMQEYDVYVKCSAYPKVPSKTPQKWVDADSGGFKTIGFRSEKGLRGSYMVSTTSAIFTAIGIIDVDGDGVYATYVTTKSQNPNNPITGPDVY